MERRVVMNRVARFFWYNLPKCEKYTKWSQNILNGHKIYQMVSKYTKWQQNIPNGSMIDQMDIKYTNIFHWNTLQNLPKLRILVWK
jgi:hypothetical protein